MKRTLILLVLLVGCVPSLPAPVAPTYQALSPAVELPERSLLPEAGPVMLPAGKTLSYGASCFTNEQAAALAGELRRLDGRDEAVQSAERSVAAIVMAQANADLAAQAKLYQDAFEANKRVEARAPYWLVGAFVAGAGVATTILILIP